MCCILLCRIAEFSACWIRLRRLIISVPPPFITPSPTLHSHSFPLFTFVSFLSGPSFSLHAARARVYSINSKTDRNHSPFNCFNTSRHFHISHQSKPLSLSPPHGFFLLLLKVAPFYRRGQRVIYRMSLPCFLCPLPFPSRV